MCSITVLISISRGTAAVSLAIRAVVSWWPQLLRWVAIQRRIILRRIRKIVVYLAAIGPTSTIGCW